MAEQSFEALVQELASVHQRQQSKIELLRQENVMLRARLKEASASANLSPTVLECWSRALPLDACAKGAVVGAGKLPLKEGCLCSAFLKCLPLGEAGGAPGLALGRELAQPKPKLLKKASSNVSGAAAYRMADFFTGLWADERGEFFGGSAIQLWAEGWRPLESNPEASRKSSYAVQFISPECWELIEENIEDGSVQHFVVERLRGEDKLLVWAALTRQSWKLERVDEGNEDLPQLWPEWRRPSEHILQLSPTAGNARFPTLEERLRLDVEELTGELMLQENTGWLSSLVMSPTCIRRVIWDVLSSMMVFYDVITVPLMVFDDFDTELSKLTGSGGFTITAAWVITVFWTLDFFISFFNGYHNKGMLEMRPARTAFHYVRTWMGFDLVVLLPDWVFLTLPTGQLVGLLRVTKGVRFMRILRAVRLLRFMRLQRILTHVLEMVNSETLRSFLNIVMVIAFIVCINHYLACGWFLVGKMGVQDNLPNWMDGILTVEQSRYGYVTALHWSLTQFTPASMDVHARNVTERVYTICVLFFAMVTFSSFLASITAAVSHLRHCKSEQMQQKYLFRRYLSENRLSAELGNRIWFFLKQDHFNQKRLRKDDVKMLRLLPMSLKQELCNALYLRDVVRLPVFKHLSSVCDLFAGKVCLHICERSFNRDEDVFSTGSVAHKLWILISGETTYHHFDDRLDLVSPGLCICEQVLWLQWQHCGQLVSKTTCEFLTLEAQEFRSVIVDTARPHVKQFVQAYATRYRRHMKSSGHLWRTDLGCETSILESLVKLTDKEVQEWARASSNRLGACK
mmetsp:Transcript_97348/g.225675  ORF Transcript_97348/g.225675 Transcript_97348/m.225675 type:complete len:800 (+) Transcript_97348:65-2464(+)